MSLYECLDCGYPHAGEPNCCKECNGTNIKEIDYE